MILQRLKLPKGLKMLIKNLEDCYLLSARTGCETDRENVSLTRIREEPKHKTYHQKPGIAILIAGKIEPFKEMQRTMQWQKTLGEHNSPKLSDLYLLLRKLGHRIKYSKSAN